MTPRKFGRYEIQSEIGRGGMATVYRAHDPRLPRDVAIKVLPREFLHNPAFRARFNQEAETYATLEHTAIVPVYDFGEQDGQPYIVMRYMPGGSLADRIAAGPIPVVDSARVLERIGSALDSAHRKGIIHRDLKPSNILFDQYGDAYLADFGIAKIKEAQASFTGSAIIGTPAYLSPEQARGVPDLDGRSDIYVLGSILFEMLTGRTPFEADTPIGLAWKHVNEPVPNVLEDNPDLPPGCDAVIDRAMAKNRDERFSTASEMAHTLNSVAKGEKINGKARTRPRPAGSRRWVWVLGGFVPILVIAVILGVSGVLVITPQPTPTATPESTSTRAPFTVTSRPAPVLVPTLVPTKTPIPSPTMPTPTRVIIPTLTRTTAPTPTPVPLVTTAPACVYDVELVEVRDRYLYWYPNSQPSFELLLRNSGTCAWPEGTELGLVSDNPYGWSESWPIGTADVGQEVSVGVTLAAPGTPQLLSITWQLRRPDGELFGQEITRTLRIDSPTPTPIRVQPSATLPPPTSLPSTSAPPTSQPPTAPPPTSPPPTAVPPTAPPPTPPPP